MTVLASAGKLFPLLWSFLQIGLFSIGGGYAVIPLIRERVVDANGWLTTGEFTDIITISQMTPGPLAVNTSTFVGIRVDGVLGAVAATFGCVFSGFCVSLLLYRFFQKNQDSAYAGGLLRGLKASSLGLIASAAGTILIPAVTMPKEFSAAAGALALRPDFFALALFILSLAGLRKWKLNPILVMALAGAAGFLGSFFPLASA